MKIKGYIIIKLLNKRKHWNLIKPCLESDFYATRYHSMNSFITITCTNSYRILGD